MFGREENRLVRGIAFIVFTMLLFACGDGDTYWSFTNDNGVDDGTGDPFFTLEGV